MRSGLLFFLLGSPQLISAAVTQTQTLQAQNSTESTSTLVAVAFMQAQSSAQDASTGSSSSVSSQASSATTESTPTSYHISTHMDFDETYGQDIADLLYQSNMQNENNTSKTATTSPQIKTRTSRPTSITPIGIAPGGIGSHSTQVSTVRLARHVQEPKSAKACLEFCQRPKPNNLCQRSAYLRPTGLRRSLSSPTGFITPSPTITPQL